MLRILDRYLLREVVLPFILGLTVLTFLLELPPILQLGEDFIARGVEWSIIVRVLVTLLPQALCLTIPMAVLLGILLGFGRLSADREFVAMQACGVSLMRLARPVLLLASVGTAATAYETIVALPDGNQTFRDIVFVTMAERIESQVKPRVFFQEFAPKVLYVREVPPEGGWRDVFLADTSVPGETTVYFAKEGRVRLDREKRLVQLELKKVASHTTRAATSEPLDVTRADELIISLDPSTVFKRPPSPGAREMTYAQLYEEIDAARKRGDPAYEAHFMVQQKLSLPMTCPILALIGLALGATNRKDGKLAGFAVGGVVIFAYYVLLFGARSMALGGRINPNLAPWVPNIVMGIAGAVLLWWRSRSGDQPIRFTLPTFWRRRPAAAAAEPAPSRGPQAAAGRRVVVVVRVPQFDLPSPRILDLYLSREYIRVVILAIVSLLGLFYISTLIDLIDKLFRGETTSAMLLRYFVFRTPQFVFYVIPMSVLVGVLVTIGVMTKNGELLVMRACGISLYRTAAPLLLFGLIASGVLFLMQERVLTHANREADRLERSIRRRGPATLAPDRRWMVGTHGEMYHYDLFDQNANRFTNLLVYRLDDQAWQLTGVTHAAEAVAVPVAADAPPQAATEWTARHGWTRELKEPPAKGARAAPLPYQTFDEQTLTLESTSYFKTDDPVADLMTYGQLRDYIARLRASGANVVPQMVALQRKIAFPFVTVVMTLLAVPFAITTGPRGAMYGVGIGLVIAISYWVLLSVSVALGAGGVLTPMLGAWAPNILFSAIAFYLVLTVRT